ncbi:hypothetical protein LTR53_001163 [Teratosphaeriaceae sp. CCFEE 6253]|nr:hypothetical protein LTR53_001163 [Teratosphaeriaceae sp. CCFEE 6253]
MADATSSPPRVSRYRSQRRAQQAQQDAAPEVPPIPQDEPAAAADNGPTRTRSRYHRKANGASQRPAATAPRDEGPVDATHRATSLSPTLHPAQPVSADAAQHRRTKSTAKRYHERHASPPTQLGATDEREADVDADGYGGKPTSAYDPNGLVASSADAPARRDARPALPASQLSGELFPPPRPELERQATRPVTRDGPPASNKISATRSTTELLKLAEGDEERGAGCFGLFKRKRGETSPGASEKLPPTAKPLQDIPVSAVNSGDRRVLVECGKSSVVLPVTETTTAAKLLQSAAEHMAEQRLDVHSAVVLEHFGSVGIQRPLRRYERIRDVMNSWDSDRQNSLLLVDPGTGTSEAELSLAGVPQTKPGDLSWLMTYSHTVGKWAKRTVTLRPDGQIVVQKDPVHKPQQVDSTCHLSDYDIYTPTAEKLRRRIRPPKKFCYAVKSQQKAVVFETTRNFVHFFCTADRATAESFYAAVQGWRSWYLVNVLDEGKKPRPATAAGRQSMEKTHTESLQAQEGGDTFEARYQLGSFKPAFDGEQFDKRAGTAKSANGPGNGFGKSANQFDPMVSPERRRSTKARPQARDVLAEDEPLANLDRKRMSVDHPRPPDEFAAKGMLSRNPSQRQRDGGEKATTKQPSSIPELALPHASDRSGSREGERDASRRSVDLPSRTRSTRLKAEPTAANGSSDIRRHRSTRSTDLGRSGSSRAAAATAKEPPKPLVDLRPQYHEPPQHVKKGKGHKLDMLGPGGLVEAATSPEDFIGAPPATDWRGRNALGGGAGAGGGAGGGGLQARPSQRRTRSKETRAPAAGGQDVEPGPFSGEGLMAGSHAHSGWGGGDRGRGVMDGSRAKGPMLDLNDPSRFAPGSLLNKVERESAGTNGLVVDRGKEV